MWPWQTRGLCYNIKMPTFAKRKHLGHLKIGDFKQAEKKQIFSLPWDGNETHFVYFWITCYTTGKLKYFGFASNKFPILMLL